MKDNRVRVALTKKVDLAVLDQELGGHGLCGSDTEIVAVDGSPVTESQLVAAIFAHIYVDPLAERVALRESAESKLKKLGLTIDEINAITP
jgi:hypothetical protein